MFFNLASGALILKYTLAPLEDSGIKLISLISHFQEFFSFAMIKCIQNYFQLCNQDCSKCIQIKWGVGSELSKKQSSAFQRCEEQSLQSDNFLFRCFLLLRMVEKHLNTKICYGNLANFRQTTESLLVICM